jgi:hypothetical protein
MITGVSSSPVVAGTVLTLDRTLSVPLDPGNIGTNGEAHIWVDTLVGAVQIPAGSGAAPVPAPPVSPQSPTQQVMVYGQQEIISQGMRSASGDTFSQGMRAESGPWAGQYYSQGMMMPGGDYYSQGMQITIPPATYSEPPNASLCPGG